MADYYDRLESQLADLTERGAHRPRLVTRLTPRRFSGELVAAAAVALVALVVVAVFLSTVANQRPLGQARPTAAGHNGPVTIRNFAPDSVPLPAGRMVWHHRLKRQQAGNATGIVKVYNSSPNRHQISISASGLKPNVGTDMYAVWLLPAVRNPSFVLMQPNVPVLVGVIKPRVGSGGRLEAEGTLPHAGGLRDFELLITLEPSMSTRTLGRYVLEGPIAF
jgi:hypothetical protein